MGEFTAFGGDINGHSIISRSIRMVKTRVFDRKKCARLRYNKLSVGFEAFMHNKYEIFVGLKLAFRVLNALNTSLPFCRPPGGLCPNQLNPSVYICR